MFPWDREGWLQAALASWRHTARAIGAVRLTGTPLSATVAAYPSVLHRLALEAEAGRLSISPRLLFCGAELLHAHMRDTIEAAFGAPVVNTYACSESWIVGYSYSGSPALHLVEDVAVYEPVDREGRLVPAGERAAKLLVTNVINHALPLLRYELTDEVTFLGRAEPGAMDRTADRRRRGAPRRPVRVRPALGRDPRIVEYQVRQTPEGACESVLLAGVLPLGPVRERLVEGLRRVGLAEPIVDIREVETVERLPGSGKVRRFIPCHDSNRLNPLH